MKALRVFAVSIIALAIMAACSDVPESVDEAISSLPEEEDVTAAAENIQTQVDTLTEEIENSAAADDLRDGWTEVQSEIESAVASITNGDQIDTEAIEAEFDEFQADVQAARDDVSDELVAAWNSLREQFEQLTS
jgi:hypothetical protein